MSFVPGIFNDVLSPVTPGPSSSNTCGPYRIARLGRCLLGEEPVHVTVRMAADGGYGDTFYAMYSDKAVLAGALGRELTGQDLKNACLLAEESGLSWDFLFAEDMPLQPSELMDLTLQGANRSLTLRGASLGGGEIEITRLNGREVRLTGRETGEFTVPGEDRTVVLPPVYPFAAVGQPPFTSAREMLAYAQSRQLTPAQTAYAYESALTGASEETLRHCAEELLAVSDRAIRAGGQPGLTFSGVTAPKCPRYAAAAARGDTISLGTADRGVAEALALMEYSNAHGIIACMPTGGAAGIVPAVIRCVGQSRGLPQRAWQDALMTAGLIGTFFYPTHYSGALGCQAEIGVAIAMAAAAAVSLAGGDCAAAERAASFGAQSVMGLLCNPVEGYVQVPCMVRNMTAVPTAITCANAALGGLDALIPLDEAVQLMLAVGEKLRPCNRAGTWQRGEE